MVWAKALAAETVGARAWRDVSCECEVAILRRLLEEVVRDVQIRVFCILISVHGFDDQARLMEDIKVFAG